MTPDSSQASLTGRSAGLPVRARRQPLWPLFLVLAAPSVYFFYRFPPLWRDSDGFFQLGSGINEITIIHWPPLYCLSARVFLLAGALVEGALHGALGHFHWSFGKPTFTNTGMYVLLAAQHLALVVSLLVTVATLAGKLWVRLLLALGFALNPSLYAFAHCVGTEAFSNPLTLLTFAASVKAFRRPGRSGYRDYALALAGASFGPEIRERQRRRDVFSCGCVLGAPAPRRDGGNGGEPALSDGSSVGTGSAARGALVRNSRPLASPTAAPTTRGSTGSAAQQSLTGANP